METEEFTDEASCCEFLCGLLSGVDYPRSFAEYCGRMLVPRFGVIEERRDGAAGALTGAALRWVVHDDHINLVSSVGAAVVAFLGIKWTGTPTPELLAVAVGAIDFALRAYKKSVRLTSEEYLILAALKTFGKGGATVGEIADRVNLDPRLSDSEYDDEEVQEVLQKLSAAVLNDGTKSAFVGLADEHWRTIDV